MRKLLSNIYGPFNGKRWKDMIVDLATFITIVTGSLSIYGYFAPDKAQMQLIKIAGALDSITESGLIVDLGDIIVNAHIRKIHKDGNFDLNVMLVPTSKEIENISLNAYTGTGELIKEWSIKYINVGNYRSLDQKIPFRPSKVLLCYSYQIDSTDMIALKITGITPEYLDEMFSDLPDLQKPITIQNDKSINCEALISKYLT